MKNLKQLAEISNGKLSGSSINVDSFSIDTRTINPNEAYIALKVRILMVMNSFLKLL
jgi:UDP-N-acetylmuramyl pentapeptide synthase